MTLNRPQNSEHIKRNFFQKTNDTIKTGAQVASAIKTAYDVGKMIWNGYQTIKPLLSTGAVAAAALL